MYGWRARIGIIVPSSNTTMETEFSSHAPEGVSIHTSRLPLRRVTEKELLDMANEVETCAKLLSDARVDVIIYGCTSGSLIKGKGYDEELEKGISEATGIPAISTARAVLEALEVPVKAYVLQNGRVMVEGTGEELLNSNLVKKAYLGM